MSGPKSYEVMLTPEERARIQREAEERRRLADFRKLLSGTNAVVQRSSFNMDEAIKAEKEKIRSSISGFSSGSMDSDFSEYEGEYIPTQKDIDTQKRTRYDNALEEYARICAVLDRPMANCFDYDEEHCDEITQQMISETERLHELQIEQIQNQHIYESSIKVLEDMGYKLIGDNCITKRSGSKVRSTLLRLDEKTAVNLVQTSNGQYTFELVGVSDDYSPLSEADVMHLFELMKTTCHADFPVFRAKLREYGVLMENTNERPPAIEYCRAKNIKEYSKTLANTDCESAEEAAQKKEIINGSI